MHPAKSLQGLVRKAGDKKGMTLTHRERRALIERPLPTCAVRVPGKSWGGVYIPQVSSADHRYRWNAIEDEQRLRQLLAEEESETDE